MTKPTKGFRGEVCWVAEATYGNGIGVTGDTALLVSNYVQSLTLSRNSNLTETRNIKSYDTAAFIQGVKTHGVTLEYLQDRVYSSTNCVLARAIDRITDDIVSLGMQVGVGTTGATSTYFNLKGCVPRNATVATEEDGPVRVTIDYSVKDVAVSSAAFIACTDTITTQPYTFVGGSLKRGGSATWGYIVGSVNVTIDNGIEEYKDIGTGTLQAAVPGPRTGSATVDVCLTDGGTTYWNESATNTASSLQLCFGASTADPSIVFSSAVIGSLEIPLDSDSAIVKTTVPITAAATTATANDAIKYQAVT